MNNLSFFSVLRSNLKCAFCKRKDCRVRYYPERKKTQIYDGTRYVDSCSKDREKWEENALKRKLP